MDDHNFKSLIDRIRNEMIEKEIQVNLHGPNSLFGKLLHVGSDFLVISVRNEGIVYTNIRHIKNIKLKMMIGEPTIEEQQTSFITADNFYQLLKKLKYSFLQVNRGPEVMLGMLLETHHDWISLSDTMQSLIVLPTFHIKFVSMGSQNQLNILKSPKSSRNKNQKDERSGDQQSKSSSHSHENRNSEPDKNQPSLNTDSGPPKEYQPSLGTNSETAKDHQLSLSIVSETSENHLPSLNTDSDTAKDHQLSSNTDPETAEDHLPSPNSDSETAEDHLPSPNSDSETVEDAQPSPNTNLKTTEDNHHWVKEENKIGKNLSSSPRKPKRHKPVPPGTRIKLPSSKPAPPKGR